MASYPPNDFAQRIAGARRILVMDLGFLGDTIYLIPAVQVLRDALPKAHIDVQVATNAVGALELFPWIDGALGYPRRPRRPKIWQDIPRVRNLRRNKYDAVIDLNGSDRSSLLTRLTGARWRLGRRPQDGGPWHWDMLFTHIVEAPYLDTSVYDQRRECLRLAGFPVSGKATWNYTLPAYTQGIVQARGLTPGGYFHLSPCAGSVSKELAPELLADIAKRLLTDYPTARLAITCSEDARELEKVGQLEVLLGKSDHVAIWRGGLTIAGLAAIISGSILHLGGDTGSLHVAVMCGKPTVSWYKDWQINIAHWGPRGDEHIILLGKGADDGVKDITPDAVLGAVSKLAAKHA